jgi:hypothetical protein
LAAVLFVSIQDVHSPAECCPPSRVASFVVTQPREKPNAVTGSETKELGAVVQIDDGKIRADLDEVVRTTAEETLNALLDAKADFLCGVRKSGRSDALYGLTLEDSMNDLQKKICFGMVNIFERCKITGNYGAIGGFKNDAGHLSYGRSQVSLSSGNLFLLIKAYCDAIDAQ